MTQTPDKYAVFGNPVAHSKSPQIHALFAEQMSQEMVYANQLVEPGGFAAAADGFFAAGGKGLNITVPFKEDAFRYAKELTARAQQARAVNTLALQADGSVLGDNTDGFGMVRDITENLDWAVLGKRVLVLGAGGAVRGVLEPLLTKNPQHIVIANRTASKALTLCKDFAELGYLCGCGLDMLPGQEFDLVINGTSASLAGELPPLPDSLLAGGANCYDMMYGTEPTPFMQWAKQHGAGNVADGLGMLVEQAAEAFALWRGCRPATETVIQALRDS